MGRLEKKIEKKMDEAVPEFNKWFDENKEKLDIASDSKDLKKLPDGNVLAKSKRTIIVLIGCCLALICVGLCLIPFFQRDTNIPHTFEDNDVYNSIITEEDWEQMETEIPFLEKFNVISADKLLLRQDDSLVFAIVNAEVETDYDYYLATIQIEYNENYIFLAKDSYDNLSNNVVIGTDTIYYQSYGLDSNDMYWYLLRSETNGHTIYWEIHCFEESLQEFIQFVFVD